MAVGDNHIAIQDIIQNLGKVADNLNTAGRQGTENVASALKTLKKCVEDLAKVVQKDQENLVEIGNTAREHEDEIDHLKQKSLKGKVVITSKVVSGEGSIKTATELEREGTNLANHVAKLVKHKYNIDITEDDIASCFHLPKGGIMVTFLK